MLSVSNLLDCDAAPFSSCAQTTRPSSGLTKAAEQVLLNANLHSLHSRRPSRSFPMECSVARDDSTSSYLTSIFIDICTGVTCACYCINDVFLFLEHARIWKFAKTCARVQNWAWGQADTRGTFGSARRKPSPVQLLRSFRSAPKTVLL
jgi:hypothetical protein